MVFERGLDHGVFGKVGGRDFADDAPVMEDVDPVAMEELVHFGRVPQKVRPCAASWAIMA